MMNLVIGICFGIAAAVALLVMWRVADRLRGQLRALDRDARDNGDAQSEAAARSVRRWDHQR
jgi:hypothetical protein